MSKASKYDATAGFAGPPLVAGRPMPKAGLLRFVVSPPLASALQSHPSSEGRLERGNLQATRHETACV